MQWNKKDLSDIINKGKKAIHACITPYLDNPENDDLFTIENFAYLWAILGAINLENMTNKTHHKIWEVLKQTDALDAHDKGMLLSFTQNIAKNTPNVTQKYWLDLDTYDIRVKFCQEILWEILKNNEDLTKEVAPYCLDGVRLVESLVDRELIPQVESYLDQLRGQGASCGVSGGAIRDIYEKEAVFRKVCLIVANLKRKLAFDEKEYLFRYFHEVYLDGYDPTHIGLDDGMLSRLMADEELDGVSELEAHKFLDHNCEIAEFSKELDKIYGFCENTAAKLVRHDTSHITNMVERCLARIEIDEKPKGVLFALELVNLNQMKTAVTILIELAKKGRATEMPCFLHRILPKISGSETMIMKILRLNLQQLHLDDIIGGNAGLKEYVLRTYLNAVEAFVEANYTKEAAELLQELVNGGWFLGSRNLVYTKFIDISNKIIALDTNQTTLLCAIAKKLNLKIYTNNDIVSIGKEIAVLPSLMNDIPVEEEIILDNTEILADDTEIIEDTPEIIETDTLLDNVDEAKELDQDTQNNIEETEESLDDATSDEKEIISDSQSDTTDESKQSEDAFQAMLNQFTQSLPEDNTETTSTQETATEDTNPTETENEITKIDEGVEDKKSLELPKEDNNEEEKKETTSDDDTKIDTKSIFNITQIDVDKHFEKIKDITSKASKQAEKIKEKVENIDIANSKSVEKIKEVAKKISLFKWKK